MLLLIYRGSSFGKSDVLASSLPCLQCIALGVDEDADDSTVYVYTCMPGIQVRWIVCISEMIN